MDGSNGLFYEKASAIFDFDRQEAFEILLDFCVEPGREIGVAPAVEEISSLSGETIGVLVGDWSAEQTVIFEQLAASGFVNEMK